jgi:hypothetical protein
MQRKTPSKSYFMITFDHAFQGERHVAFEIGGGVCGSGYPDYDNYFSRLEPDINMKDAVSGNSGISPMRRRMFEQLAASVQRLFIVNNDEHYLLSSLGENWIKQFRNITYFKSFIEFCDYARAHPECWPESLAVMDCLSQKPQLIEEDFAAILNEMNIAIPVVNAGGYRFYDDKVIFTHLFSEKQKGLIAKTWLVDYQNYKQVLAQLNSDKSLQYILKLPCKSNGRDTVIVSREHLATFVQAVMTKNFRAIAATPLPATDRKCLEVFVNSLDELDGAFIIRECIVPDVVNIEGAAYHSAARSVMLACYNHDSHEFDFIKPIANYWQRPAKPVIPGQPLQHDNLITSNVQHIQGDMGKSTLTFFSSVERARIANACSLNCAWTEEQNNKYIDRSIAMAKEILNGMVNTTKVETLKSILAADPKQSYMCRYVASKLNLGTLACYDPALIALFEKINIKVSIFAFMQTFSALRGLTLHKNLQLLPAPLFALLQRQLKRDDRYFITNKHLMAEELNNLPATLQKELVLELKKYGDELFTYFMGMYMILRKLAENQQSSLTSMGQRNH